MMYSTVHSYSKPTNNYLNGSDTIPDTDLSFGTGTWSAEKITAAVDKKNGDGKYYKVKMVQYIWLPEDSLHSLQHLINKYWQEYSMETTGLLVNDLPGNNEKLQNPLNSTSSINTADDNFTTTNSGVETQSAGTVEYHTAHHAEPLNPVLVASALPTNSSSSAFFCEETPHVSDTKKREEDGKEFDFQSTALNVEPLQSHLERSASYSTDDDLTKDALAKQQTSVGEYRTVDLTPVVFDGTQPTEDSSYYREYEKKRETCEKDFVFHSTALAEIDDKQSAEFVGQVEAAVAKRKLSERKAKRRDFRCEECARAFNRSASLKRHMITHTGEKSWLCKHCGKAYSQKAVLHRHLRIHDNRKSFKCSLCEKSFIEKSGLLRHHAVHETEKAWKCELCDKKFVLKEYLRKHMILHSGEKPFVCNACDKKFTDCSSLKRHKTVHEKQGTLSCSSCERTFKSSARLHLHANKCA